MNDLLKRLHEMDEAWYPDDLDKVFAALRAVLELHQQVGDEDDLCSACFESDEAGEVMQSSWPCPTVQAIAKALGVK